MRLEFGEHPDLKGQRKHARVAHGDRCVALLIEAEDYSAAFAGVTLDPATARALGRRLIQQANASEHA